MAGTSDTAGQDATSGKQALIKTTANGLWAYLSGAISGERVMGATTGTDYLSVAGEWKALLVNTNATGDVIAYNGPAVVRQVRVRNTSNAGVATVATLGIILVKDGATVRDGAAATKAAGTTIYEGLDGTQFRTNLTLNFASASDNPASDGKIEVLYRPLDPAVTW